MFLTFIIRVMLYYIIWTISSSYFEKNIIFLNSSLTFLVPFIVENIISVLKIRNKIYRIIGIIFIIIGIFILVPAFVSINYSTKEIVIHPSLLNLYISRGLYWSVVYIYSLSPTMFDYFLKKGEMS